MTPDAVLGLVLAVGPYPGGTLYSQTPVHRTSSLVVAVMHEDHGRSFRAYRHLTDAEDPPHACSQRGNVACVRPRYNATHNRWQRPETFSEGLDRYWQIAQAISATNLDEEVLKVAITVFKHESGMFRRDVHSGENHKCDSRKPNRPCRSSTKHEDGGLAWSFGQLHWSREPHVFLPIPGFKHIRMGELVGLDAKSTALGVMVPIERLRRIVKRCGKKQPSCVFTSYGGTVSPDHPFIKARISTYARIQRMKPTDRTLSSEVREALGLAGGES